MNDDNHQITSREATVTYFDPGTKDWVVKPLRPLADGMIGYDRDRGEYKVGRDGNAFSNLYTFIKSGSKFNVEEELDRLPKPTLREEDDTYLVRVEGTGSSEEYRPGYATDLYKVHSFITKNEYEDKVQYKEKKVHSHDERYWTKSEVEAIVFNESSNTQADKDILAWLSIGMVRRNEIADGSLVDGIADDFVSQSTVDIGSSIGFSYDNETWVSDGTQGNTLISSGVTLPANIVGIRGMVEYEGDDKIAHAGNYTLEIGRANGEWYPIETEESTLSTSTTKVAVGEANFYATEEVLSGSTSAADTKIGEVSKFGMSKVSYKKCNITIVDRVKRIARFEPDSEFEISKLMVGMYFARPGDTGKWLCMCTLPSPSGVPSTIDKYERLPAPPTGVEAPFDNSDNTSLNIVGTSLAPYEFYYSDQSTHDDFNGIGVSVYSYCPDTTRGVFPYRVPQTYRYHWVETRGKYVHKDNWVKRYNYNVMRYEREWQKPVLRCAYKEYWGRVHCITERERVSDVHAFVIHINKKVCGYHDTATHTSYMG